MAESHAHPFGKRASHGREFGFQPIPRFPPREPGAALGLPQATVMVWFSANTNTMNADIIFEPLPSVVIGVLVPQHSRN
jgi:hypothetical protein